MKIRPFLEIKKLTAEAAKARRKTIILCHSREGGNLGLDELF
jgi:hypothetical protein